MKDGKFESKEELFQYADQVEATLTEPEQRVIAYHRRNLDIGATSPDGRVMTAFMMGPMVQEGKYKGMIASVPGFVPGHNDNKPMQEGQALAYWKDEIEQGLWPIYDPKIANQRSAEVHVIMDSDSVRRFSDGVKKD